ncbi:MAG TPA: hypothetical protein PKL48_08565 [Thermodesulfobacteriota bacterium]|nr:hypothetical protein [Thermodesulfobacteriota bacterium]
MKLVYLDVVIVALEYFMTLRGREVVYEWVIPAILAAMGSVVYCLSGPYVTVVFLGQFTAALINLFAILVGFTIATVAVFTTTDKERNHFLSQISDRQIGVTQITWYRFIYIHLIYAIIAGIILLAMTLCSLLLIERSDFMRLMIFLVLVFGASHVLLLTMRNVTNLYYAFFDLKHS